MMSKQPLTSPSWDLSTYEFDPQDMEYLMQSGSLSDTPVDSTPRSLPWVYPAYMNSDMTVADVASNPGMVDSCIGSRSSTLSTYPESNTFNVDNSVSALDPNPYVTCW
jgi:hypothetical protein